MPAKKNLKLKIVKPTTPAEFNKHGDDSSDDEDVKSVQSYVITEQYEKFNKEEDKTFDDKLSFIAHALGLKVLYSPQVNAYYSSLKEKYLSTKLYDQVVLALTKLTKKSLTDALNATAKLFFRKNDLTVFSSQEVKNFTTSILSILDKEIKIFVDMKVNTIISFLKNNRHKSDVWRAACTDQMFPDSDEKLAVGEKPFLNTICINSLEKMKSSNWKYPNPLPCLEQNINKHNPDLLNLKQFIIDDALELAKKISPDFRTETTCSAVKKKVSESKMQKDLKKHYPHFFEIICSIIEEQATDGNRGRMQLGNLLANKFSVMLPAYIQYLSACDHDGLEGDAEALSFQPWQISHEAKGLKHFLNLDDDRLQEDLSLLFRENFNTNLDKLILERAVLPPSRNLTSKTPYGFFAIKRLVDRSQRRFIRNISDTKLQTFGSTTSWQWQFSDSVDTRVPEEQNITYNSSAKEFGRSDRVTTMGNYKEILGYLDKLKLQLRTHNLPCNDKDIANDIRKIFKGELAAWVGSDKLSKTERQIILNFLSSITYLLFGCETRRNPGLIILNQMLLDLIIANKLTWEEAFKTGTKARSGLMPMTPKGAVSIGRQLNSDYETYLPRSYYYEGTEKEGDKVEIDKRDLIKYEAAIFVRWLEFKKEEELPENLSFENLKEKLDELITTEDLTTFVESVFPGWFDVPAERAATQIPDFQ